MVQHFTQGLEIPMGTRWVLDLRESVSHVIMEKKKNLTFISDFAIWKRILTCLDIIEGFKISV